MNIKNNLILLKKLRNITNISIIECKKALIKNKNDIKKSIIYLKKKNYKIKKKIYNNNNGFILNKIIKNTAVMIQINCESDFVSKNIEIKLFAEKILNFYIKNTNLNINKIKNIYSEEKNYLTNKVKENIEINNLCFLKGNILSNYLHNFKIGTILHAEKIDNKKNIKQEKIKKISMHISALNPKYINKNNILKKYKDKEKKIKNLILEEQLFIFDNKTKVKYYLLKNNIKINNFFRFEIKKNNKIL